MTDHTPLVRLCLAVALSAWTALAGCGSDAPEPATTAECEALRDHVIELRLPSAKGDPARRAEVQKHLGNLRGVLGADFLEDCRRQHTRASIECALNATSTTAVEACRTTDS